jgi:transposase
MELVHHRHDISDKVWALLEPHLPGRPGDWGGIAKNNRLFINAVLWILRTGAPWRDLPPDYGDWKNTHRRFSRWKAKGIWEKLLEIFIKDPDYEWLMIDATFTKCHVHAAGAKGGNQKMAVSGLNSKVHLAVDAAGMPVRIIITDGTTADCTQAESLITGLNAGFLLADKGYDSEEIVDKALDFGMVPVIPPRKNRKNQREYDKDLYKKRHLVENAFLKLKQWRGISTRYAKNASSFEAAVQIKCLMLWLAIF